MTTHHDPRSSGRAHARARVSAAHLLGLFVFYTALAFGVFAFTFFYIFTGIELRLVIVLTLVIGVVATFVHVKAGRRTRVDSLVDKGLDRPAPAMLFPRPIGEPEIAQIAAIGDPVLRNLWLFRSRQQEVSLLLAPFTIAQWAEMQEGRVPPGGGL